MERSDPLVMHIHATPRRYGRTGCPYPVRSRHGSSPGPNATGRSEAEPGVLLMLVK